MGYRSGVYVGVAFASEEDMKEVLAVYALDPRVQKHDLLRHWKIKDDNILCFERGYTKWYHKYEEVEQGVGHILDLAESFHSERDMPMAFRVLRVSEYSDIAPEDRYEHGGDDGTLINKLSGMWRYII